MRRAALLLAACLAGCASTAPAPGEPPWTSGRMFLRVDADGARAAQSLSAGFELRGSGQRGELRLSSPLGNRLAQATWGTDGATLTTAEGERRFPDLDALARGALGEALPLAALPDWLAGRPWPAAPHVPAATGFEQLGWQVDLSRFDQGWLQAQRAAAPAAVLRLHLDAVTEP